MHQITVEQLNRLLATQQAPCVSLYQPTHRQHPDNKQDRIRYRNLLTEMESSLEQQYPTRLVRTILEKFQALVHEDHFWNHRTDALAIFCSADTFEIFELQRPVKELLVVADSFHTKPLLRIVQSADRYQILCLTRNEATLYEGNRDALHSVELTDFTSHFADVRRDERSPTTQMVGSYGAKPNGIGTAVHHGHEPLSEKAESDLVRFFREVDRGILEHHSRPSGLPLLLAALPETHALYRKLSVNPFLLSSGIETNPDALNLNDLRVAAWKENEPQYLARLEKLKEDFHQARTRQAASDDLSDVAKAAVAGQVATLLIEADRVIPGVIDRDTGAIGDADIESLQVDDMLDDLAEIVLAKGGEVVVVPTVRMPTPSGLAAVYRYTNS